MKFTPAYIYSLKNSNAMRSIAKAFLLICFTTLLSFQTRASHCAGGEIIYKWQHDSTYRIMVKFYRDCTGVTEDNVVSLCYNNTCNADFGSISLAKRSALLPDGRANGSEIATGCPGFPSTCTDPTSLIPGFREWWYEGDVTLPSKCRTWRFYISISARNTSVNINGGNLYLEATLNNADAPTNSSPEFTVKPVPYVCINQKYSYNNGVVDADGDSLVFEAMQPQTNGGVCFNPPFNVSLAFMPKSPVLSLPNNPFQTNNSYSLSTVTGNINFTPGELGPQTITFRAKEYRKGILIGSVIRDIQVQVMNCSLSPMDMQPLASTFTHAVYNDPNIDVCQAQPFSFCFEVKAGVKGTILVASDNHLYSIPNAFITYTNQNSDSIRGCFSWSPTPADTELRILTVTVKDSTCVAPGVAVSQTFTIPINFNKDAPSPKVTNPVYRCLNTTAQPLTATGKNLLWYTTPTGGVGSPIAPNPPTSTLGSTTYYVSATPNGCESPRVPITVIVSTIVKAQIIRPGDSVCQYFDVNLINYYTHLPGFKYTWSVDTGNFVSRDTTGFVVVNWGTPGLKKLTLKTSDKICEAFDTTYLYVKPTPVADFGLKDNGCIDEEILLTPHATFPAAYYWTLTEQVINDTMFVPSYKFKWHTTGQKMVTLKLISENGCNPPIDTQVIYINENPPAKIELSTTDKICLGEPFTLHATEGKDWMYIWGPGEYFQTNNYHEATMKVERSTTVSVNVTNRWGCSTIDSIPLVAGLCCKIFMPDAFSPNEDGHNDTYHPVAIENHKIHTFIVTNRWGQTVFSTNSSKDGWDGQFKYVPQPIGTYYYYVKYICDEGGTFERKGSFALLR